MRIKDLRIERNLTQWDVAKGIQTGQRNISRWENGEVLPTSDFIVKLADFFEVTTDYLLGRSDDLGNVAVLHSAPTMTDAENEVLRLFRGLTQGRRDDLLIYLRALAGGSGGKTALPKKA